MDDLAVPVLKKCCFCLPLRYGLLVWGYLKLFTGTLLLIILGLIAYELREYLIDELEIVLFIFAIFLVEIIIHIVFIIGSHMKNVKLLKMYYYYSMFIWVMTIIIAVVCTILIIVSMLGTRDLIITLLLADFATFTLYLAMQTLLLFALRSEIIKLRSNCPYRYVKGTEDSEDAIKAEEELPAGAENKTTQLIDGKETSRS